MLYLSRKSFVLNKAQTQGVAIQCSVPSIIPLSYLGAPTNINYRFQAHDDNLLLNAEPLVQDDSDDDQQDDRSKSGKQKTPTKGKYTSFPWETYYSSFARTKMKFR